MARAVEGRQLGGLLHGGLRGLPALGDQHRVGAGDVLGVEPDVVVVGGLQSELVVLAVVSAHQHGEPVGGGELHGRADAGGLVLLLRSFRR